MSEKERIHNLELEVKHLYDMFINHVHEAKTDKPLIVREKKEKQSPEMTQPHETSKAVQSMNSESNSINSAYGADGLLDNSVSPRKEKCRVGGVPQNVPSCKELKPEVFRDCQGYTSKIVKKENTTP